MTTLLDHMSSRAPDIRDTRLPATAKYQAVDARITLPVAEPLIVVIKPQQVGPETCFDHTAVPPARLRASLGRRLEQNAPG